MKNRHSSIVMTTQRATLGVLLAFAGLLLSTGCRGYQFGNRAIFRPDIRTVHVPIFENETFRQPLGQRLTESVIREIQSRTPYQLADRSSADSVLQGRILSEQKRVLGENQFDEPRDLQIEFLCQFDHARICLLYTSPSPRDHSTDRMPSSA